MQPARLAAAFSLLVFLAAPPAEAEPQNAAPGTPATQIVGKLVEAYVRAFNAGDAVAVAACWKPDGESVNLEGKRVVGRENLQKDLAEFFAQHPGSKLSVDVVSARAVGPDLILAEISPKVTPPVHSRRVEVQASLVLRRVDERWLIESICDVLKAAESYEKLKDLQWLVGHWSLQQPAPPGVSLQSVCNWTATKSFLVRMFTVRHESAATHGTEVIGWDPRHKAIRSWIFDSNGQISEGTWRNQGGSWLVETAGVLPDGTEVSSVVTLTKVDENAITIHVRHRTKAGKPQLEGVTLTLQRETSLPSDPRLPPIAPRLPQIKSGTN